MKRKVGIVAIDDGGSTTAVITETAKELFPSVKGYDNKERRLSSIDEKGSYLVEHKGQKYIVGHVAERDCEMKMKMFTKSKQNTFFDISILTAIHQFGYVTNNIIVSNPIETFTDEEKEGRANRLLGAHTLTVNGNEKTFFIENVLIAPEGAVSYWINEPEAENKFLDIGSRTVNFATTLNRNGECDFIDTKSGTLFNGIETLGKYNPLALADFIGGHLSNIWERNDRIHLLGGGANDSILVEHLRANYFPKAEVISDPQFANALGMFKLAKLMLNE